ncbi:hypothetical protein [Mucilaginibacter sp. FT3.2]|uniref:hypothetical protein n=1 Tax=Mucilaginibacter sp. FT3.2 TaxID=2723090 RepID=UPI001620308C|nr:hypothetical protein [Mucilaginibacter sp. FT3.2]MBB6232778.1 hypothetical protein [Mucilaginibacter sp. FT3.2]
MSGQYKKSLIAFLGCLILTVTAVQAQSFAEWFSQKKTQIKYLPSRLPLYKPVELLWNKAMR